MNVLTWLYNQLPFSKKEETIQYTGEAAVGKPIYGGQTSTDPIESYWLGTGEDAYRKQIEILRKLESQNEYIAYAIDNAIKISKTPFEITFSDKVSARKAKLMYQAIDDFKNTWCIGGETGLLSSLFVNTIISGSICAESPLDLRRKTIYHKTIPVEDIYVQLLPQGKYKIIQMGDGGIVELGSQVVYIPYRTDGISPYAIPPLITAIDNAFLQAGMKKSFSTMVKHLGMLGALAVSIKPPVPKRGEKDEDYAKRLEQLIRDQHNAIKNGIANGITVGFEDMTNFHVVGANLNSANAVNLAQIVNQWLAASVKSNPSMLGSEEGSARAFGQVVENQLIMNAHGYQQPVAQAYEWHLLLFLLNMGFRPGSVTVTFEKPSITDKKKDEETYQIKLQNAKQLITDGIIDQNEYARIAGYEKPALPQARATIAPAEPEPVPTTAQNRYEYLGTELRYSALEPSFFDKTVKFEGEGSSFGDPKLDRINRAYQRDVLEAFEIESRKAMRAVKSALNGRAFSSAEQFTLTVIRAFNRSFEKKFETRIKPFTQLYPDKAYNTYRSDKKVFGEEIQTKNAYSLTESEIKIKKFVEGVPDAVLDTLDYRLIDFFKKNDQLYLGKFITEPETIKRFADWLSKWYGENGGELGKDSETLNRFIQEFGDEVNGNAFIIRRVIETTLNNARGFASVKFINQAGLTQFKRIEVMDRITCAHCQAVNGKVFTVQQELQKAEQYVKATPQTVGEIAPFGTNTPIERFSTMSASEMQAVGVGCNALHPHCRGRIVAVFG